MKHTTYKLLVIVFSLVILIGGSMLLYQNLGSRVSPDTASSESGEELAPDFSVQDSSDGVWKLSDFRGTPVVINFWSSRCEPCKQEMPDFHSAWEKYGDQVEFMMINLTDGFNDTFESAMELVEKEGYQFPVYFDLNSSAAAAYRVSGMPMSFFIDAEGHLVSRYMGAMSAETLDERIQDILGN